MYRADRADYSVRPSLVYYPQDGRRGVQSVRTSIGCTAMEGTDNEILSTGQDPLLETAMRLHDLAIKDEYFVKRKLAPNVDFW